MTDLNQTACTRDAAAATDTSISSSDNSNEHVYYSVLERMASGRTG